MDKHEYRLKTEQMLKYLQDKSYKEAFEIAESIDWRKVKNVPVLCAVSEIYEYNGEYQQSRDILFLAYDRSPDSKKIIYRLGTLALKLGEWKEAADCYDEFVAIAPKDPNRYVFKYKILKSQNAPLKEQIAVLEEFKKIEYVEKWAFELAQLYQEAGMITECLEECDDLILWFSEGKYIYKAMELKMQYKPLTPLQHEKYMSRTDETPQPAQAQEKEEEPVLEIPAVEEKAQEDPIIEIVPVEEALEEISEEISEEVTEEEAEDITAEEVETAAKEEGAVVDIEVEEKPSLSIEEMVQEWEEQQKENAQIIQDEFKRIELEKLQSDSETEPEEEKEEILSDDVRRLMEELEAESAEIDAQKSAIDLQNELEKIGTQAVQAAVVAETVAAETVVSEQVPAGVSVSEEAAPAEAIVSEQDTVAEAVQPIEEIEEVEEDEGIKLGDTQSIALSTKALASAAKVGVPQENVLEEPVLVATPEVEGETPYDTGFVVHGRYDLEAQSEIGLKAGLTEEQKKLFSYFVPVHGMSEQLVKVLQDDRACKTRYGTSRIGNILVIGRRGSGKTVLAVDIVKAIQKARKMKQGKVAIVTAESLNKKNVEEIVEKLHGGALVIERACRLKRHTIDKLCDLMEGQTGELLVVLEDERKPMDKLLAEYPNFKKKFTSRIELPVFINDELVTFAQTYAKENGYKIDEMGILALYSDIDTLQREEKIVTVADVKALVDDAIENANRASVKKLVKKVFGKNKDESDRVILKEEDFR